MTHPGLFRFFGSLGIAGVGRKLGYGAGKARPIPPYLSIHHGNYQRAAFFIMMDAVKSGRCCRYPYHVQ